MRYRWAVLAAGTAAQTGAAIFGIGLPVIAPALQDEYGLSIGEVGLLLAAPWIGGTLTLLPWGIAADRFGERAVLALGLGGSALVLAASAYAQSFEDLMGLLAVAGAAGSSVQSASGRAVMHWFDADERGLALGIRQTSIPLGGLIAALRILPSTRRMEACWFWYLVSRRRLTICGTAVYVDDPRKGQTAFWVGGLFGSWMLVADEWIFVLTAFPVPIVGSWLIPHGVSF